MMGSANHQLEGVFRSKATILGFNYVLYLNITLYIFTIDGLSIKYLNAI